MKSNIRPGRTQRRAMERKTKNRAEKIRTGKIKPNPGPLDQLWRLHERVPTVAWVALVFILGLIIHSIIASSDHGHSMESASAPREDLPGVPTYSARSAIP